VPPRPHVACLSCWQTTSDSPDFASQRRATLYFTSGPVARERRPGRSRGIRPRARLPPPRSDDSTTDDRLGSSSSAQRRSWALTLRTRGCRCGRA